MHLLLPLYLQHLQAQVIPLPRLLVLDYLTYDLPPFHFGFSILFSSSATAVLSINSSRCLSNVTASSFAGTSTITASALFDDINSDANSDGTETISPT